MSVDYALCILLTFFSVDECWHMRNAKASISAAVYGAEMVSSPPLSLVSLSRLCYFIYSALSITLSIVLHTSIFAPLKQLFYFPFAFFWLKKTSTGVLERHIQNRRRRSLETMQHLYPVETTPQVVTKHTRHHLIVLCETGE